MRCAQYLVECSGPCGGPYRCLFVGFRVAANGAGAMPAWLAPQPSRQRSRATCVICFQTFIHGAGVSMQWPYIMHICIVLFQNYFLFRQFVRIAALCRGLRQATVRAICGNRRGWRCDVICINALGMPVDWCYRCNQSVATWSTYSSHWSYDF